VNRIFVSWNQISVWLSAVDSVPRPNDDVQEFVVTAESFGERCEHGCPAIRERRHRAHISDRFGAGQRSGGGKADGSVIGAS